MTLSIHNSLTGSLELFSPQKPLHAGVYVCGPTVYDHAHIGHARSAVFFDVVVRYLKFRGYKVIYVRNFTDIDDKIIEKAGIENKTIHKLADEYIDSYRFDMDCLGVHAPDHEPRVTDYIPQIIRAISILVDNNNAYANAGNVWFRTCNRPGYGLISGLNIKQDDTADSRLTISEGKEDARDFALWKKAEPGSPSWQSPWGRGRPGWHIECAVMSNALLGASFDIHGGGRDLIFPHHENERAISLALTECEPAKYWIHHALVTLNGRKLSKSGGSGPAYMIRDLCKKYSPKAIRLFLLSVHYRRQLDVTAKRILEKEKAIKNLSLFIGKCRGIFDD
jgi:cysteinyl-tRNA synthetase